MNKCIAKAACTFGHIIPLVSRCETTLSDRMQRHECTKMWRSTVNLNANVGRGWGDGGSLIKRKTGQQNDFCRGELPHSSARLHDTTHRWIRLCLQCVCGHLCEQWAMTKVHTREFLPLVRTVGEPARFAGSLNDPSASSLPPSSASIHHSSQLPSPPSAKAAFT